MKLGLYFYVGQTQEPMLLCLIHLYPMQWWVYVTLQLQHQYGSGQWDVCATVFSFLTYLMLEFERINCFYWNYCKAEKSEYVGGDGAGPLNWKRQMALSWMSRPITHVSPEPSWHKRHSCTEVSPCTRLFIVKTLWCCSLTLCCSEKSVGEFNE